MKHKTWILEILRWLAAVAAIVCLVSLLKTEPVSDADFSKVLTAVTEQADTSNMLQAENQMVKRLYGLDPSAYEGCALYYPATNMDAEELLLIKLKDENQQADVRAAMEKRIENQKNAFEGYGIEQFDLLSNACVLEVRGKFALLAVTDSCDAVLAAFRDTL